MSAYCTHVDYDNADDYIECTHPTIPGTDLCADHTPKKRASNVPMSKWAKLAQRLRRRASEESGGAKLALIILAQELEELEEV
jgi:hypothetical protein